MKYVRRTLVLAAWVATAGCGEHAGPDPSIDPSTLNNQLYCPAEMIELSPERSLYTGSFSEAQRWLGNARGEGPQVAFRIPPHSCPWQVESCGSSVDTILSVADSCAAAVSSFDRDVCTNRGERITLDANPAAAYLALGAYSEGATGTWMLRVTGCAP